jgi:2-methylcitrate dehydratase
VGPDATVTGRLAAFAAGLEFADLPGEVVHQAKRILLDALACALGGRHEPDVRLALRVYGELCGPGPATVIGEARTVDPASAALLNALMVRVLDYNDIYWDQDPSHPSDLIPAALSCCERAGADGRALLVGIVLGHELEMRLCEAADPGIRERGWHHATLTAVAAPLVAGRCLRLPAAALQHAVGIAACHGPTLGAVTAGALTMMKNTVDAFATQKGVVAALLAEAGYTGPAHVLDGKEGLTHCLGPSWRLGVLTAGLGASWRIPRCGLKAYPTEALTHSPITGVLALVREHDLRPEAVARVEVRTVARAVDILADPPKYDPRTRETADHSLPYVVAAALVDRRVTPAQLAPERIADPVIRAQLPKVAVVADPELEKTFPARKRAVVSVTTVDGRVLTRVVEAPKGDPDDPLTDAEIEEKLDALAAPALSDEARRRLKDTVWGLERQASVGALTQLLRHPL